MTLFKLFVFCLVALISTLASKITVIAPGKLADQFDEDIEFAISHFGTVPYGAHLVGKVFLGDPIGQACNTVEPFSEGENTYHDNIIAIVKRGGCRVSTKTRNVQFAGAKALILVSDRDNDVEDWFGHEQGTDDIKIPTLMVTNTDGTKIINYLNAVSAGVTDQSEESKSVIISISFPTDPKSSIVQLDFWYSAADTYRTTYSFLKRFYEHWQRNQLAIRFVPHFVTWSCAECRKVNFTTDQDPDCLSGGRYCVPDPDEGGDATGADVVREDLRQVCIYNTSPQLWWVYVLRYGDQCLNQKNLEMCGQNTLLAVGDMSQAMAVETCIKTSYEPTSTGKPVNDRLNDNKLLREEKESQIEYSIHQFPALFINHKPFYGKLHHTFLVFEEACRNLENMPDDCKIALMRTGESAGAPPSHTGRVIILIIMMTVLAVLIFFCCRKMVKSESRDMSLEVGGLVTKYFALKDTHEQTKEEEEAS